MELSALSKVLLEYYTTKDDNELVKLENELRDIYSEERFGEFNSAILDVVYAKLLSEPTFDTQAFIAWCKQVRKELYDIGFIVLPEFMNDEKIVKQLQSKIATIADDVLF
jgi:hypothetical protein